jgi:hypothetical protein
VIEGGVFVEFVELFPESEKVAVYPGSCLDVASVVPGGLYVGSGGGFSISLHAIIANDVNIVHITKVIFIHYMIT